MKIRRIILVFLTLFVAFQGFAATKKLQNKDVLNTPVEELTKDSPFLSKELVPLKKYYTSPLSFGSAESDDAGLESTH